MTPWWACAVPASGTAGVVPGCCATSTSRSRPAGSSRCAARTGRASRRSGYGPERLAPPPPFSVSAYLRRHAGLRGLDRAEGERRTGALVERLGLGALVAERLDALSKGSLQKVVLVQALLGRPRLAVLDEPYAGLDGEAQDAVRGLLGEQEDDDVVELAVAARDGDVELASLLARGWHVVSYVEGRGDTPARIRARRP
jgi:translation initiation factor RLI1